MRKTVTVLFADLVGSTSFGERMDAEVARSVMARYHALLQEAVDAHGGTVAKFMGDGMMATFGIPEIAEDDAIRAVRAGLDMQRRFHDFAATVAAQHGETLGLRVGVNTGEVVIASGDADLVGDALNVAARIEHACRHGQVAVGEDTWRLTRAELGYEPLGEVSVAGRAQPVAMYEVAIGAGATVEVASPFVGRDAEMERLRSVLNSAISSRSARLVTVLGSPGVGKTRLSRELCATTETDDDAITFEIRCDRAGDSTFAPIAQLIRDATDLGDDADAESVRERLGALFANEEAERDRLVDILGGLVGAAPTRNVEETFWAVRRLVSATAARRPLVVVIDDIQWAEPLLLDLLEHLAEWVHDVPLLLLCLARPELRESRPSLAERNRRVADLLALDGLDSAATEALAAGLLGTNRLPAGLVERLPTSTDGNPLFVRELVRMLVDDQVIRRRGDEWELTIDAAAVEVPPTIQSLLAARVERLPPDERTVLELASVIGAEFNAGALRALTGPDTPLPTRLESMRRKELVEPTGAYWGDEPVFRFHHVLIRDAVYRRLLKTTRADLHEKVAVWTDAAAANRIGEHEAAIAFHYEQAYRYRSELGSVDDHVTELGRRAAELLSTAADRALGRDDLAAAGALARRAFVLLPESDAGARADLLMIACECTLASGDVVGARPVVEQLRVEAGDDPALGAWASCFEAQLVGLTDPDGLVGAEAVATGAAKVMDELGDGAGEAKAHQVRAGLLARLGRVGDAEIELDLALGAARRVDDRRRVTAVLGAAPNAALWGPSPVARAGGRCLDVVRLLRITTASPSVEATSMRCQAVLEALRGRFDVARSMLASSRATLEELGLRHGLFETAYLAGVVELVAGHPAAAIGPLRDAYEGLIEMGVGIDAGRAAALLAHALVAVGRVDDAEPFAAASEELAGQDLKTAIAWRGARAEVLAARGDVAGGIALAEEAVEIAAATDLVIDHADACVVLAALRDSAGDATGSFAARAEARRLFELKGAVVPAQRLGDSTPAVSTSEATAPGVDRTGEADLSESPLASAPVARAGPPMASIENVTTRVTVDFWTLCVNRQFDLADALMAEEFVHDDRRATFENVIYSRAATMDNNRMIIELGFESVDVDPVAVRGDRLALARMTYRTPAGDELVGLQVLETDVDGRRTACVSFDAEDLAAAIDELDARYVAGEGAPHAEPLDPRHPRAENSAATVGSRLWELYVAGQLDQVRALLADDAALIDKRTIIGMDMVGGDAIVANLRFAVDLGAVGARVEMLAVRGTRLCLGRLTTDFGGFESVFLSVGQLDDDGLISHTIIFDEDALDEAIAELDARYFAGEGAALAPQHQVGFRSFTAANARDWDAYRDTYSLDLVCTDRRQIGWPTLDRAGLVATIREYSELAPDLTLLPRKVQFEGRAQLWTIDSSGTTPDGGGVEWVQHSVSVVGPTGVSSLELFDEDDFAAALARFDELGRAEPLDPRHPRAENAATRSRGRILELFAEGRFDDAGQLMADDFERVDRRTVVSMPTSRGRDVFIESSRATFDAGFTDITHEPIAVRGDRLELSRVAMRAVDGHEIVFLNVAEIDEGGRAKSTTSFDENALDDAVTELNTRYLAGEGASCAADLETGFQFSARFNAGDWDEIRPLVTEGFEVVDTRRLSWPSLDREEFVAAQASYEDQIAQRIFSRCIHLRGTAVLATSVNVGADSEGGEFEWVFHNVATFSSDHRIERMELFDEHDFATALARLDELGKGTPADPRHPRAENAATRHLARLRDVLAADGIRGFVGTDFEVLAVRGERISLARVDVVTETDDIVSELSVSKVDADGLAIRSEVFEADDSARAVAVLDAWYLEGEGAGHAAVVRPSLDHIAAFNRRDWDALVATMRPDIVIGDHRGLWPPTSDRAAYLARMQSLAETAPDSAVIARKIHVVGHASLVTYDASGSSEHGDRYEYSFHVAGVVVDGTLGGFEFFADDDFASALARFDELGSAALPDPHHARVENGTTIAVGRFFDLAIAGRFDEAAELLTPDIVRVDHRTGVSDATTQGRDEYMAALRATFAVGFSAVTVDHLAVRRERLALFRSTFTTDSGMVLVILSVGASDTAGRVSSLSLYDEDALDDAVAELEARFAVAEPRLVNAAVRRLDGMENAFAARDWDWWRRALADDVVNDDRRPTVSSGRSVGHELAIALAESLASVGFTLMTQEAIAIRGERLALFRRAFQKPDGFDLDVLALIELDDAGFLAHNVLFDPDDRALALNELDRRYATGEGSEHADVIDVLAEGYAAMNRRDFDAWAAIHTPNHTSHDHSLLGFGEIGMQTYRDYLLAAFEQVPDFVFVPATLEIDALVALVTIPVRGATPAGFEFENDLVVVTRFDDDLRIAEDHFFSGDQQAAARALFEAFAAASGVDPRTSEVENAASRHGHRAITGYSRGDFDRIDAEVAEDAEIIDRRTVVSIGTVVGHDAVVANVRAVYEVFGDVAFETVAVRGDRLALLRLTFGSAGGFVASEYDILEINTAGQTLRMIAFDESSLTDALAELEDRYCAGEGAGHECEIRRVGDVARAARARDHAAAYHALHAPGCVVTDHRLLSWPTSTPSDIVGEVRADRGLSQPRTTVFASLEIRGDATLVTQDDYFVTPEGNEYTKRCLVVTHSVAGLTDSVDFFEPEQHAAARAWFEELGAETRTPYVDNPVVRDLTRAVWREEFDPTFDQVAEMEAKTAADIVIDDRRRGVSIGVLSGRDELADNVRAQDELFGPTTFEPIAVRGEHLALLRTRAVSETGFELVSLAIAETNTAGKYCAWTFFDDTDLRLALDTLDARHDAIRVDTPGIAESGFSRERLAFERGDWEEVATCFAPDFVAIDHRPLGFVPATVEEYLARSRELVASAPGLYGFSRKSFFAPRAGIAVTAFLGASAEGSEYEWNLVWVASADAHGRYLRIEYFPEDQWVDALARFDELVVTSTEAPPVAAAPTLENAVVRTANALIGHGRERDLSPVQLRTLLEELVSPDITRVDRHRSLLTPEIVARDAFVAEALAIDEQYGGMTLDPIALRGDRLALFQQRFVAENEFESVLLALWEAGETGMIERVVTWREDDLEAAFRELESRYDVIRADRPTAENTVTRLNAAWVEAKNAGRSAALEHLIASGYTVVSHRFGGIVPASEGVDQMRALSSAGDEVGFSTQAIEPVAIRGERLALVRLTATTADGYVSERLEVTEIDEQHRFTRTEIFDVDALADAAATLNRWHVQQVLPDRAFEAGFARLDALDRGDRDAVLATYAPDFVREDRRRGVNFGTSDREETVDALLAGNDVGLANREFTVVEVVGDHCVLVEFRMSHDDGFELVYLLAQEVDASGRLLRAANFDIEDRDAASALLHEWAAARERLDERTT